MIRQFIGLGPDTAVYQAFSYLTKRRAIWRIARGIYVAQQKDCTNTTPEQVAMLVAEVEKVRLRQLCSRSQSECFYLTSGASRRIRLPMQNRIIVMRHANPHEMDHAG
jgi:hypothetical protein